MKNVAGIYPLTSAQSGMLFHSLQQPEDGVYVVQYTCEVAGPLDTTRLRAAWDATIAAHPALRTACLFEGLDEPLQVVRETVELPWRELDWTDASPGGRMASLEALLAEDRSRGFDLARAPLTRITIVQLGPEHYRLIWTYHHIVADGWSSVLVLNEVWDRYRSGAAIVSRPVAPSFGDFVDWSRNQGVPDRDSFWKGRLADADLPTTLGFPGPRGDASKAHERHEVRLSREDTDRLRVFASSHRLTLNTVVHGAWALAFSRSAATPEVVYGATLAGRPHTMPDVDRIVGAFINTLPVRVRTDDSRSLVEWLGGLQDDLLALRGHELSSLADVARAAGVSASDLFDTILVFENAPPNDPAPDAAGIRISNVQYFDQSNYGLAVLAHPEERLSLQAVFRPDRIRPTAARRLLDLLAETLRQLPDHEATAVGALGPPWAAEREALLGPLAADQAPEREPPDVLAAFLEHAARAPDATAILGSLGSLSYGELAARAGALAGALRDRGVGRGDRVAIVVPKGPEFVAAVLGTLWSGASYIPLDPGYPASRITLMLNLASASLVVVAADPPAQIEFGSREVMRLASVGPAGDATQGVPSGPPIPNLSPADMAASEAYVIFTSGSTGHPKGVSVSRANLAYSTDARSSVYGSEPPRFLLLSPIGFDSSVAGLFWPLSQGGQLVFALPEAEKDPRVLAGTIRRHDVTTTLCVPSFWRLVLEQADEADLQSLHTVIVAGEACSPETVRAHGSRASHVDLVNEYGPTECTVWSTYARLEPGDYPSGVPIGRPIPGATARILDSDARLVPIGVTGELYVGGPGVAGGYVDLPDETSERFIDDPFESVEGARLYRTGDLARMDDAGVLFFHGRNDDQLKIRGYRIEPIEVETALERHPEIAEAVVVAHRRHEGNGVGVEELATRLASLGATVANEVLTEIEALERDHVVGDLADSVRRSP